jgi:GTP-binding protein
VREASTKRIGTGALNRIVASAITQQPPAHRGGKRFKVLYCTQPEPKRKEPIPAPEIVIFCNDGKLLDTSYRRFLEGKIRKEQPWPGLPVIMHFRERKPRAERGR